MGAIPQWGHPGDFYQINPAGDGAIWGSGPTPGSNAADIPFVLNESTDQVTGVLAGGGTFRPGDYTAGSSVKFAAVAAVIAGTYYVELWDATSNTLVATLSFNSPIPTLAESATLTLDAAEHYYEVRHRVSIEGNVGETTFAKLKVR